LYLTATNQPPRLLDTKEIQFISLNRLSCEGTISTTTFLSDALKDNPWLQFLTMNFAGNQIEARLAYRGLVVTAKIHIEIFPTELRQS